MEISLNRPLSIQLWRHICVVNNFTSINLMPHLFFLPLTALEDINVNDSMYHNATIIDCTAMQVNVTLEHVYL